MRRTNLEELCHTGINRANKSLIPNLIHIHMPRVQFSKRAKPNLNCDSCTCAVNTQTQSKHTGRLGAIGFVIVFYSLLAFTLIESDSEPESTQL